MVTAEASHPTNLGRVPSVTRLRADHAVTPDGVLSDAVIEVAGDRIVSCTPYAGAPESPEVERVDGWVVPGFVDVHVHGGGGFDYPTEDPAAALAARAFHAAHGTTTTLASLVTAPLEVLHRQLTTLADLVEAGHFAGIHLEGPFLSPAQRGAHHGALLRTPDPGTVDGLVAAGRGHLAMVTLAPELPGALAAVARFVDAGVRVAVGHTDADRDAVAAALDAGATVATHLFNAIRGLHHREPGPVPLLLTDPRVAVELIADGVHLHPDVLRMAVAAAGSERVLLVTDAMAAAGRPDGAYALGGQQVQVRDGTARLVDGAGRPGAIAGSTLTMAQAFRTVAEVAGIEAAAAMASTNPARRLGLPGVGRIEAGARADLCVVGDDGGLVQVMQAGRWVPGT